MTPIKRSNKPISTNLIIGRLGSGKTSCIQSLLKTKPDSEFWAVLINEFGQLGLDAALLAPETGNQQFAISEISGGCICCSSRSQLQVSLTQLIRQYHPQRLLIEATGLGHPAGIVDLLRSEHLANEIKLETIICLTDCRMFDTRQGSDLDKSSGLNERLLATETIQHQFELADVVVLNKTDLATEEQLILAYDYFKDRYAVDKQLIESSHGQLDQSLLRLTRHTFISRLPHCHSPVAVKADQKQIQFKNIEISQVMSSDNEHFSIGYLFPVSVKFERQQIETFLQQLQSLSALSATRIKAVFNCGRFWYSFNITHETFEKTESFYRRDSRIEIIFSGMPDNSESGLAKLQSDLLNCIIQTK